MKFHTKFFCGLFATMCCISGAHEAGARDLNLYIDQARVLTFAEPVSTVFVANPKVATYKVLTPNKLIVFGAGVGNTSFIALNEEGKSLYESDIQVDYNLDIITRALKKEFPSLNIKLTPAAECIIVSGEVPTAQMGADVIALVDSFVGLTVKQNNAAEESSGSAGESQRRQEENSDDSEEGEGNAAMGKGPLGASLGLVINRLTVTMPTQVMIRVRIAEVKRDVSEKLGVNWFVNNGAGRIGGSSINFGITGSSLVTSASGYLGSNHIMQGVDPEALLSVVPDFSVLLDALAEENLVSILAEPNLMVSSGETASFFAGGEIPTTSMNNEGVVTSGNNKINYGITLTAAPIVLSENRISLKVSPEVNELDYSKAILDSYGNLTPATLKRNVTTTIDLASGQSFAIGGLLQNNISNNVTKFPFLGDIPILGALFRSSEFQKGETELVVIATAYVGQPSDETLRIPNANIVIPNVFNRLFLGQKPTMTSGPLRPEDLLYY